VYTYKDTFWDLGDTCFVENCYTGFGGGVGAGEVGARVGFARVRSCGLRLRAAACGLWAAGCGLVVGEVVLVFFPVAALGAFAGIEAPAFVLVFEVFLVEDVAETAGGKDIVPEVTFVAGDDAGGGEDLIGSGGAAHAEEGVVIGRLPHVGFGDAVESVPLGSGDGDDEGGAAEAVDIVVIISEDGPSAVGGQDAEAGVEVFGTGAVGEVAGSGDAGVVDGLEAEGFVGGIFDGDVAAVHFRHAIEEIVGAVEGLFALKGFGGDGAVEAEDADGVDGGVGVFGVG